MEVEILMMMMIEEHLMVSLITGGRKGREGTSNYPVQYWWVCYLTVQLSIGQLINCPIIESTVLFTDTVLDVRTFVVAVGGSEFVVGGVLPVAVVTVLCSPS